MVKIKTLIKRLMELEVELGKRKPEDIVKTIDELGLDYSFSLLTTIYEGACNDIEAEKIERESKED